MKTGDTITVTGKAGRVIAEVLDERAADELPQGMLADPIARMTVAERYDRLAMIAYRWGPQRTRVVFVAMLDAAGTWWDMRGHALEIAPASAAEAAEFAKEDNARGLRQAHMETQIGLPALTGVAYEYPD